MLTVVLRQSFISLVLIIADKFYLPPLYTIISVNLRFLFSRSYALKSLILCYFKDKKRTQPFDTNCINFSVLKDISFAVNLNSVM